LTFAEFEELLKMVDPLQMRNQVLRLFKEALEKTHGENMDAMSPEAFCEVAIENKIGKFGKDLLIYYYQSSKQMGYLQQQSSKRLSILKKP
jgi:uncharacterized protein YpbB